MPGAVTVTRTGTRSTGRPQRARFSSFSFRCAGPCGRTIQPGQTRRVTYLNRNWCQHCYEASSGFTHTGRS